MPKGAAPSHAGIPSVNQVLRQLKRQEHGLFNCVASIISDAAFVKEIAGLHPELPVTANLRCGAWYVPQPDATCYFKSTDGHAGYWSFSLARLNWHLALLAAQQGGCFIVDATRRGKTFPDALTKTIPIWAAVLNGAVARVRQQQARPPTQHRQHPDGQHSGVSSGGLPDSHPAAVAQLGRSLQQCCEPDGDTSGDQPSSTRPTTDGDASRNSQPPARAGAEGKPSLAAYNTNLDAGGAAWDATLHLPLWISSNERLQIEQRLPAWIDQLFQAGVNIAALAAVLAKPLRPLWLSPASRVLLNHVPSLAELPFTPLFLVSASDSGCRRRLNLGMEGEEPVSFDYVPGAGDDEESWALGLTPELLWAHRQELLAAGPGGIADAVASLKRHAPGPKQRPLPEARRSQHALASAPPGPTDLHNLSPLGCATAAGAAPVRPRDCFGVQWIADTGIGLAQLPLDSTDDLRQHIQAVLNVGKSAQPDIELAFAAGGLGQPQMSSEGGSNGHDAGNHRSCSGVQCPSVASAFGQDSNQVPVAAGSSGSCKIGGYNGVHSGRASHCCAAATSADDENSRQAYGGSDSSGSCEQQVSPPPPPLQQPPPCLHVHIASSKLVRTSLQRALPRLLNFIQQHLAAGSKVAICSDEGLDAPVCVAVAALLTFFQQGQQDTWILREGSSGLIHVGSDGSGITYSGGAAATAMRDATVTATPAAAVTAPLVAAPESTAGDDSQAEPQTGRDATVVPVDKAGVRRCLAFVSGHCPDARPTRGMLKQVFSHFQSGALSTQAE